MTSMAPLSIKGNGINQWSLEVTSQPSREEHTMVEHELFKQVRD